MSTGSTRVEGHTSAAEPRAVVAGRRPRRRRGHGPRRRLHRALPAGHFGRSVALLAGGTGLAQAVLVLVSPALTRLYTPADMGVLALYTSVMAVPVTVSALRLDQAVPLPDDDAEATDLLILGVALVLVTSGAVALALLSAPADLAARLGVAALGPYAWFVPVGMAGGGLFNVVTAWAIRRETFAGLARVNLVQSVVQAVSQVALGVAGLAPGGLLVGKLLGFWTGVRRLGLHALRDALPRASRVTASALRRSAGRYRRFMALSTLSAVLNTASLALPVILVYRWYGAAVAGWFALAHRVVDLPAIVVGMAVSQVFTGEAAAAGRTDPARLRPLAYRTARRLALWGLLPSVGLAVAGPLLFGPVFGSSWETAGVFVAVSAPMVWIRFIAVPVSHTLLVTEQQGLQLCWDVGRIVLLTAGLAMAGSLDWSATAAVAMYSGTMTVSFAALAALALWVPSRARRSRPAAGGGAR